MNEAILGWATRMIVKERLARAKQARLARSVPRQRRICRDEPARARRSVCRRSGQAAY